MCGMCQNKTEHYQPVAVLTLFHQMILEKLFHMAVQKAFNNSDIYESWF